MKKEALPPDLSLSILKVATCSTLSGRSELTYHLARNSDAELLFRVVENTGNGQFNSDWIALAMIEKCWADHPTDKPLTSRILQPLFRGKSSNSPAFLFACLMAEGLVKAGAEKDSGYLLGDIEAFKQAMSASVAAGIDLSTMPDTPRQRKEKARK